MSGAGSDRMWEDSPTLPSPYPGWMHDDEGSEYEAQVAQRFLTAMSSLAATVCVVAVETPTGDRAGITATAVCSLSTDPPQLIACVNRGSSIARALGGTGWFSVSILAGDQEPVAAMFAGRTGKSGSERFDDTWSRHTTGAPVLGGAAAVCVCHVSNSVHQASHLVLIGRVLDVILPAGGAPDPLMYHMRRFTTVSRELATGQQPGGASGGHRVAERRTTRVEDSPRTGVRTESSTQPSPEGQ